MRDVQGEAVRTTIAAQLRQSCHATCLAIEVHLARGEAWPADLAAYAAEVARNQAAFSRRVWS